MTTDLRRRYSDLEELAHTRCKQLFETGPGFRDEIVAHCISDPTAIEWLKSDLPIEEIDSVLPDLLHESRQWLYSLNTNFNELSLDQLTDSFGVEIEADPEIEETADPVNDISSIQFDGIEDVHRDFLNSLLTSTSADIAWIRRLQDVSGGDVNHRIDQLKRILPPDCDVRALPESTDPIDCFRAVFLDLRRDFPPFFFTENPEKTVRPIIQYLQKIVLELNPADFHKTGSIQMLYQYRLQGIARRFNYSWSRLIQFVYPDEFLPWQLGKVNDGYWEDPVHRIDAIRWIIESYFNVRPSEIWQLYRSKQYTRKLFGKLGLSYLYNSYYNGILKPLEEAYPEHPYWHFGIYPDNYWEQPCKSGDKSLTIKAFKWMLNQAGIPENRIPEAIRTKRLSRQLFQRYNLTTMFEYCYQKSLHDIVNTAFPNRFKPWEIGNVKTAYWESEDHRLDALNWFLKEQNLERRDVIRDVRRDQFAKRRFVNSRLASFFRKIFKNDPAVAFSSMISDYERLQTQNERITTKLQKKLKQRSEWSMLRFILYGFNTGLQRQFEKDINDRIERKLKRRKRILRKEEI